MRLRKKNWSADIFAEYQDFVTKLADAEKGTWKKKLNNDKLILEIGSGKGDYWHQMAALYPDRMMIALERDYTACAIALKKCAQYQESNKHLIYGDLERLSDIFAEGEIMALHLNFSDPWPKNRHEKRRLTHPDKLKDYLKVLDDEGSLVLKTDNAGLFNYSVVSIGQNGFEMLEFDVDFRSKESSDPFTEYERKFHELGQPIYRALWRKKHVG